MWESPRAAREDRSRWVGIPSRFVEISLEIHASVSLHMHTGNAERYITPLLALELTQAYCSFVLFSHSLDCISCSYEEMCDTPIGTTSWSPAKKWNGLKMTYSGRWGCIVTTSCLTKAEEPSLPFYLPIAGGRVIGFISFPRVLVRCEMQLVSSRIWTRVGLSISYDDNHYTIVFFMSTSEYKF